MKYRCIIKYILHDVYNFIKNAGFTLAFLFILALVIIGFGYGLELICSTYPILTLFIASLLGLFAIYAIVNIIYDYLKTIYNKCR